MPIASEDVAFKFQYIGDSGQPTTFRAKKGSTTVDGLMLDNELLRYADITDTTVRDNRLIIATDPQVQLPLNLRQQVGGRTAFALQVQKIKPLELEKLIDKASSRIQAERNRDRLIAEGKEGEFRAATCPHCEAVVDFSGYENSPYIYCRFCESVFDTKKKVVTVGSTYRCCDECGMFDRIRGYSEFYFYFLLVVYGWRYKRSYLCDACAHKLFLRTFFINFIFVLGVPLAVYNKIVSMTGRDPQLRKLAKANAHARKGHYHQADAIYKELFNNFHQHPGLLMNQGLGHINGNDPQGGTDSIKQSMKACSNYEPTMRLIFRLSSPPPQQVR